MLPHTTLPCIAQSDTRSHIAATIQYAVWVFYCKNLGYTTGTTILYQLCARIHKPLHGIHQQPPLPGATLCVCKHASVNLGHTSKPAGCLFIQSDNGILPTGRSWAGRPPARRWASHPQGRNLEISPREILHQPKDSQHQPSNRPAIGQTPASPDHPPGGLISRPILGHFYPCQSTHPIRQKSRYCTLRFSAQTAKIEAPDGCSHLVLELFIIFFQPLNARLCKTCHFCNYSNAHTARQ